MSMLKNKRAILLPSYDVERYGGPDNWNSQQGIEERKNSVQAVEKILAVHQNYDTPVTLYFLGRLLELETGYQKVIDHLGNFQEKVDIANHTYSHPLVRPHQLRTDKQAISSEELAQEIAKTQKIIKDIFGYQSRGLKVPLGYYQGLQGYPEVLKVISDSGLQYIMSDYRNAGDLADQPVSWLTQDGQLRQPYFYTADGFPQLLEITGQGWHDCLLFGLSEQEKLKEDLTTQDPQQALAYYLKDLKFALDKGLVFAPVLHPWSLGKIDPEMVILKGLLSFARDNKILVLNHKEYYNLCQSTL